MLKYNGEGTQDMYLRILAYIDTRCYLLHLTMWTCFSVSLVAFARYWLKL